jgi:hypothetical protein
MAVQITLDITPIEIDGKHWVRVIVGDHELKRRGPFKDANAAKAAADRLLAQWQPNTPTVPANTVVLRGEPITLDSTEGHRLVVFCTRAAENLISDTEVRAHFEIFDDVEWKAISENPALIKAIRQERFARINSGRAARESAAKIFAKAPEVLAQHLNDPSANVRAKVDIHRELRATVHGNGADAEAARDTERFVITFNLGSDIERIEKVITKPVPPTIENKTDDGEIVAEE